MTTVYLNYYTLTSLRFTFPLPLFLFFINRECFFLSCSVLLAKSSFTQKIINMMTRKICTMTDTCLRLERAHEGVIHFSFFRICRHRVLLVVVGFVAFFLIDSVPQYPF